MRRLFPLLLGVLVAAPVCAQETREVIVRSLCFHHIDGIKKVQFLPPGGEMTEIPLWLVEPSDDMVLKIAGEDLLFHLPAADGEEKPRLVAQGKIGSGKRHLLFFVPSGKESPPYRVFAFPDDEKSFPMGSTRLLNLSKLPAVFEMGERVTEVAPGRTAIVPMPKKVNQYNDYNFEIKLETPAGTYPVRQTRGRAVKTKRDMAVIYLDPGTKRARVNLYTDIPPWALPQFRQN